MTALSQAIHAHKNIQDKIRITEEGGTGWTKVENTVQLKTIFEQIHIS